MIEVEIHKEIDAQHALLDERRTELLGELEMLTQQMIKDLATQKDHIEMTEAKLSSCVEYAEGGLKTGTDGEVLQMKVFVLKRIEQISTEFDPNTLPPETMVGMKIATTGKEPFQKACHEFLSIDHGQSFSPKNSKTTGNRLKDATLGETKTIYFEPMTENNKIFEGQINLKAEIVHLKSKKKLKCDAIRQQNGLHEISYCSEHRGKHELHISVNEDQAQGSPFPITVIGLPEKPVRVLQNLKLQRGVAVNSKGQLLVVDGGGTCISVLTSQGEKIRSFGQFNNLFGVAVDQEDNIYVADHFNNRVLKFSIEGVLLATIGSVGNSNLQFRNQLDICYNPSDNNLYVPDQSNHRIQVLTTDFKFVRCFGSKGSGNRQFQNPLFAAVDSENNIYVTDLKNHRVQVFTAEGQFLRAFSQKANNQKLHRPWAIAIDSNDTVYVSENGLNCVSMFTSQGEYIKTIGKQGSQEGQFKTIYGLSTDCNDSLIVSDYSNGRLQIF